MPQEDKDALHCRYVFDELKVLHEKVRLRIEPLVNVVCSFRHVKFFDQVDDYKRRMEELPLVSSLNKVKYLVKKTLLLRKQMEAISCP